MRIRPIPFAEKLPRVMVPKGTFTIFCSPYVTHFRNHAFDFISWNLDAKSNAFATVNTITKQLTSIDRTVCATRQTQICFAAKHGSTISTTGLLKRNKIVNDHCWCHDTRPVREIFHPIYTHDTFTFEIHDNLGHLVSSKLVLSLFATWELLDFVIFQTQFTAYWMKYGTFFSKVWERLQCYENLPADWFIPKNELQYTADTVVD